PSRSRIPTYSFSMVHSYAKDSDCSGGHYLRLRAVALALRGPPLQSERLDVGDPMSDSKRTPLYEVHKQLGARLVPFGGWDMPVEYSGIAKEHRAVRTAAGLFDVSHMGEFEIRGPQALDLIQLVTTNNAAVLADGQAQNTAMAYTADTVVDDLLVYRRGAEDSLLVVNAGNIQKHFDWIQFHNHFNATLKNRRD